MSIVRASGAKYDGPKDEHSLWYQLQSAYLELYPGRHKWFTVLMLKKELKWGCKRIAKSVQLNPGHVCRVLRRVQIQLAALEKEFLAGAARLRIVTEDSDDD